MKDYYHFQIGSFTTLTTKPVIVFLGTYPPRECGIATFTQDLLRSSRQFLGSHISCKVAALNLTPLDNYIYPNEVAWQISQDHKRDYLQFAQTLNNNQLVAGVIVQHEYGIYGGEQGENVVAFLESCRKPILVTLHTVLPNPTQKMKNVTSRIIQRANIIVVLTQSSRKILEEVYPFAIGKVYVVPHGIHPTSFSTTAAAKKKLKLKEETILATFGLLSRGKGIEYVIRALPEVIKTFPSLKYLILGGTHPAVRRKEGEKYRLELSKLVTSLKLKDHVKFYDQYLDLDDLIEFLKATDIYISTSINPNQAVSGTLSYALGSGRAVISTAFAQAKEIITPQTGRLVPIKNSPAITAALLDLLSDQDSLKEMHQAAYESTRSMLWSNVAREYSDLLTQVVLPPMNLKHLKRMTDDFGLFQFGHLSEPNKAFGYTIDDNARALIVCTTLLAQYTKQKGVESLAATYLDFIESCQQIDGSFTNYLEDAQSPPTDQNNKEDLSDAYARAIWGLAEAIACQELPTSLRAQARRIFEKALPHAKNLTHLRSKAFVIKAAIACSASLPEYLPQLTDLIKNFSATLAQELHLHTEGKWHWFEHELVYNNALLSESLLLAGQFLSNQEYLRLGTSSLEFLIHETFSTNMYQPIGQAQWYKKNETRSYFDQQPEDPAAMILALTTAYTLTGQESYKNLARKCFSWFMGNNSLRQTLYNYETGGCYDGLHPDRVNLNQGAESLVSYLLSRLAMNTIDAYENSTVSKSLS